jgi:hypothetical protein
MDDRIEVIQPADTDYYTTLYAEWEKTRRYFRDMN